MRAEAKPPAYFRGPLQEAAPGLTRFVSRNNFVAKVALKLKHLACDLSVAHALPKSIA